MTKVGEAVGLFSYLKRLIIASEPDGVETCEECNGTGVEDIFINCEQCGGHGYIKRDE